MNDSDDMDVDVSPMSSKSIKSGIERMLELGRELLQMSLRLEKKYQNVNDEIIAQNRKMMEVMIKVWDCLNRWLNCLCQFQEAFSLLAYSNPWASPVGKQLSPSKREPICAKLNSAILGKNFYRPRLPMNHKVYCLRFRINELRNETAHRIQLSARSPTAPRDVQLKLGLICVREYKWNIKALSLTLTLGSRSIIFFFGCLNNN